MFTLPPLFTAWWGAVTKASDASLGWVTTCAVLVSGLLTYVAGIVWQQVGTRWMYVVATVLMLVSLAVVLVNPRSLPIAYVWALLSGASSAFTYSPSLTAVQEWFPRRLGLVTGLVNASFALPAAAAAPIVGGMLRNWGFTATVLTLMVAVALTQMVVIFLSTPYWLEKRHAEELAVARREISGPAVTTAQAARTPAFWQVWAMWFAGGGAAITMMTFAATYSAHLNDIGVHVSAVAAVTAFVSGNGLIRVVNAMLLDHIGPTVIGGVTSVTLAFGYMLLGVRRQWLGTHRRGFSGWRRFGDYLHDLPCATDAPFRYQALWSDLRPGFQRLRYFWCFCRTDVQFLSGSTAGIWLGIHLPRAADVLGVPFRARGRPLPAANGNLGLAQGGPSVVNQSRRGPRSFGRATAGS